MCTHLKWNIYGSMLDYNLFNIEYSMHREQQRSVETLIAWVAGDLLAEVFKCLIMSFVETLSDTILQDGKVSVMAWREM